MGLINPMNDLGALLFVLLLTSQLSEEQIHLYSPSSWGVGLFWKPKYTSASPIIRSSMEFM